MNTQATPNCINVQRALLSEPRHINSDIQQHIHDCHRCAQFAHEAACFDADINAAMNITAPEKLADKILLAKSVQQSKQLNKLGHWFKSAAASVALLTASIGSYLYLSSPLIIEEIALAHVRDELHHLNDRKNIQLAQLNSILKPLHMRMEQTSHTINYAGSCKIHDTGGVHVVLQGEHSPVTLLIMPGAQINARKTLQDNSFKGIVLPLEQGSVAIIADKQETLDVYEKQIYEQLKFI